MVTKATSVILNLINTPKASTHYSEYSYDASWSLMKEIKILFKSPLFYFLGNCGKVYPTDSDFVLASLVPLDVDVTGNITAKICEVWSEFKFFTSWLPWERPPFWICLTPKSCHILRWIFLQSMMKFDERNPYFFLIPPFCVHGNCDKVCPTNSDKLAVLVPIYVNAVPNKIHKFLLIE